jgi:hypothetical protein
MSGSRGSGAGETEGAASDAASGNDPETDEPEEGTGDIEIPIGVPVSGEEFRRLKEESRRIRKQAEDHESPDNEDESGDQDQN